MVSRFERVEDEEEVLEDEVEEYTGETYEVIDEDIEIVPEEHEIEWKPIGDPVLEYIEGLRSKMPKKEEPTAITFIELLVEFRKASNTGDEEKLRRIGKMLFLYCPLKPRKCPLYDIYTTSCPYGLENRCRMYAMKKPKKTRKWFRK